METEILKGAHLRITTQTAQVGAAATAIADIAEPVLQEGDHRVGRGATALFIAGPLAAAAVQITTNQFVLAGVLCLAMMGLGGALVREAWLHRVLARMKAGGTRTLYRTRRLGDARLVHAALVEAVARQAPSSPA